MTTRRVARTTTSDGVTVAVHAFGGAGPSLLMTHATGFHARVLEPLARTLAASFACYSLDFRAHGDSGRPADGNLDWYGFAHDVLAAIDHLRLDRPFGFGHSSGGTALLLSEAERPGTFAGLYCYEPVIVPADPPLGRDPDNWLAEAARRRRSRFPSRAQAREHYRGRGVLARFDDDVLGAYVDHGFEDADGEVRLKCDPGDEALTYEMASAHDCYARLPEVSCPVVVARGSLSESLLPRVAEDVVGRLPHGRGEELPGLSHFGPLEDPVAVAHRVRDALGGR